MSNILQDTGKIWCRLFDHKAFIGGEITFTLQEFEQKRGENEIDNLFSIIANITEIGDLQINRTKEKVHDNLNNSIRDLNEALDLCSRFVDLQERFNQDSTSEENKETRKATINNFMDDLTSKYTQFNTNFEVKQQELKKVYEDLESKLFT